MGLGGVEGPPKKKLKQAQLNFCVSTEKVSNKRKLSDSSDGLSPKLFRKDPGSQKTSDKENLVVNEIDKSKIVTANEPKDEVVVLDDDSNDGEVDSKETLSKSLKDSPDERNSEVTNADVSQVSKCDVTKPETESSEAVNASETVCTPKDEPKFVQVEKSDDSSSKDQVVLVDSKAVTPQDGEKNAEGEADSNTSALKPTSDQGDISLFLSSEDEQATEPNLKTPPTLKQKSSVTPKSSAKKAERERLREEKLRLKREKEEQKRKEKEEKEKKKQEELRLKEEEKKRKEEEKKRKEEAKEEERKRKEEERKKKEEAKEEEKRKKEEEKKKKEEMKEEDRRKKEEARLVEERKENLAKAAFTKFFITEKVKPSLPKKDEAEAQSEKYERPKFMPFPVKSDMRLAAQVRHTLTKEEKDVLDQVLAGDVERETYLKELKSGRNPLTGPATWPLSDEQHDVIIVEFVEDEKMDVEQEAKSGGKIKGQKAKLLQFHENRRPPYWGTWRKPSETVGPRRPFGQDKVLDYEVDSDSEWEDEEEGEDIEKEDGDSDKEEADDENVGENGYVLDNTFVPHGYLSDEEAAEAEDDESVEDQKLKLTVLKQEFDQELKSKTQRLQPRLLGCVYIPNTTLEVSKSIYEPLMKLRCKWDDQPIDVTSPAVVECSPSPATLNAKFPSSMVEQLAKLIHGSRSSMKTLISEFMSNCDKDTQLSSISKRAVFLKVKEIATKTYSVGSGRLVWAVNPDLCPGFGIDPIVDPPKIVPSSPVVEQPKPKDSPLVNFLKKSSTQQGQQPVKRISTTLVRQGQTIASSAGLVHVDTPRPKSTPQDASAPAKPIRRVPTTLLSSMAGPVDSKIFNVGEIDRPRQINVSSEPKSDVVTSIDLTDFMDGVTPLSPGARGSGAADGSPVKESSSAVPASANPVDTVEDADSATPADTPKDADSATPGGSDEQPSQACEPVPMETDPSTETDAVAVKDNELTTVESTPNGSKSMETEEPFNALSSAPQTSDANIALAAAPQTSVPKPSPVSAFDPQPPASSSTGDDKLSQNSDAETPQATTASVTNAQHPIRSSSDAIFSAPTIVKPIPSTPTPVRKRVPLITLSKSVSKTKLAKTPGQKISIADMFGRKAAKKDAPPKPTSFEPSAIVDLSTDSD